MRTRCDSQTTRTFGVVAVVATAGEVNDGVTTVAMGVPVTVTGGNDEGGMTQPADPQVQTELSLSNALE